MPLCQLNVERYIMNEQAPKPSKQLLPDVSKTPLRRDGSRETNDFVRHIKGIQSSSRKSISPLQRSEMKGPKWFTI